MQRQRKTSPLTPRGEKLNALLDALTKAAQDKEMFYAFLKDLLTPAELAQLPARWQIVRMLHRGIKQWEVVDRLHVAIATVTRGARMLRNSQGGFHQIIHQYYPEDRRKHGKNKRHPGV